MVTKRIILGALFLAGCTAESVDSRQDAPLVKEEVLAWSFEPASADCNGWAVEGATAIRANPPRSGTYSCKLCATPDSNELVLGRDLSDLPAGKYVLSAWIRKRANTNAPDQALARLVADTERGAVMVETPSISVREEWDQLETTIDLTAGAKQLKMSIGSPAPGADKCLFVDDVTLSRVH